MCRPDFLQMSDHPPRSTASRALASGHLRDGYHGAGRRDEGLRREIDTKWTSFRARLLRQPLYNIPTRRGHSTATRTLPAATARCSDLDQAVSRASRRALVRPIYTLIVRSTGQTPEHWMHARHAHARPAADRSRPSPPPARAEALRTRRSGPTLPPRFKNGVTVIRPIHQGIGNDLIDIHRHHGVQRIRDTAERRGRPPNPLLGCRPATRIVVPPHRARVSSPPAASLLHSTGQAPLASGVCSSPPPASQHSILAPATRAGPSPASPGFEVTTLEGTIGSAKLDMSFPDAVSTWRISTALMLMPNGNLPLTDSQ